MKTKLHSLYIMLALLAGVLQVAAQGTAFTYQGRLDNAGGPANGTYDLTYKLWNLSSGGSQVGSTFTVPDTVISNGLFTATLDFGSVFNGSSFWLELAVRTNGAASFTTLSPRQEVTPTPYAITAENVDGLVPASQLSGIIPPGAISGLYPNPVDLNNAGNVFDGNGAGLAGVNALTLDGLSPANFWQLNGNAGTTPGPNYIGTTDMKALEIDVQGQQALRIEPDITYGYHIPNIIGGSQGNFVKSGTVGNVIGGGGSYNEGSTNFINAGNYNVIGGGFNNHITNSSYEAVIAGGEYNVAGDSEAAVGGGADNAATGYASTVPGGDANLATGDYSFAAGHSATANNEGSFVWSDDSGSALADTDANQFVVGAAGGVFFYDGEPGVVIDTANSNFGTIAYGLSFGTTSGEGIASQRTPGPNQYDLNFYTSFNDRMTIMNNGFVGINTTNPVAQLHVVKGVGNGASDNYGGDPAIIADISSGDGVYVYDTDSDGYAVWATATSGIGVDAVASTGTAVLASSSSGSALTIGSGSIHVSGASTNSTSTAAFTQVATAGNISGDGTIINNTLCNGDPNAILIITPNWNPHGGPAYNWNRVVGVWYDGSNWLIFNEDGTAMPAGPAFNVLIIKN